MIFLYKFFLIFIFQNFIYGNTFNLYVLKLVKNKYYIGKTNKNVQDRFIEHKNGFGSHWTKLYKPIKIIEIIITEDKFNEDKYTKKYMDLYGIQNVRGGSYTKIILDDWQIKSLHHELKHSNNLCYKCGNFGHYASSCKNKKVF